MGAEAGPLAGRIVLVTRPEPMNGILAQRLEALGARVLRAPLLAIRGLVPDEVLCKALAEPVDALVFVSASAVEYYRSALAAAGCVPPACPAFAVGRATAEALVRAGFAEVYAAPEADETSEGLLSLPALRERLSTRIALVRGRGGREALAAAVRAAGGQLRYLEVYERQALPLDGPVLMAAWRRAGLREILVTSGESLDTLHALAGPDWSWLKTLAWFVPGARLAARAADLGCLAIVEAGGAGDGAMIAALEHAE